MTCAVQAGDGDLATTSVVCDPEQLRLYSYLRINIRIYQQ